ncbi:MAG: DUF885 domain-containing protein [Verrucomicrobiota bacterium]
MLNSYASIWRGGVAMLLGGTGGGGFKMKALGLALAGVVAVAAQAPSREFDEWSEQFAAEWVRLAPQTATITQYFEGIEQAALDRELEPQTAEYRARRVATAQRGLEGLARFNDATLTSTQRISAAVMRSQLRTTVENAPYAAHTFVFRQFAGLHTDMVDLLSERHPLRNTGDFESYLARLEKVASRIDEGIAEARLAAERGLLPPRYILERVKAQLDIFYKAAPEQNVLVTALERRGAEAKGMSAEALAVAKKKAQALVTERVRPAYLRVAKFVDELITRAPEEGGLSRTPEGGPAYARALATYTTTTLTAEEIHALGLREVARIEAQQEALTRKLGFTEGSLVARVSAATATPALPDSPDPRKVILDDYLAIIRDAERRSEALFNLRPRAPIEVRRVPAMKEAASSAYYTAPAPDGSQPGVFWTPLRGPKFFKASRSLAYHEGVPGHHFQIAIMQELPGLPKYRAQRIFGGGSVHAEGWALYTEKLAIEEGWYEGDERGQLVALGSLLFRARRLVVDTGLHAKKWTRQQAIDYGISAQEVERYVVWPGQACSYMVGMLRIVELREKAKAELGAKFSLPAFHDVVLQTGSVPLDVLAEVIEGWIVERKKG